MNKRISIIVIILVVIIGFVSFYNSDNSGDGEISIGLISSLTGAWPQIGEAFANGVILAHEEYVDGSGNLNIKLVLEDDGTEPRKGISAYKKIVEVDNIDAVINLSSPTIGSIYDLVIDDGLPFIQAGEQPDEPSDDNIFQVMPYSIVSASALGEELDDIYSPADVAIAYTNDPTVLRFVESFTDSFDGEIENVQFIKIDSTDVRTEALKIVDGEPEIVVFFTVDTNTALLIKEIEKTDLDAEYTLGLGTASLDPFIDILGSTDPIEGMTIPVFESSTDEEFVKAYSERFGIEPLFGADLGYDSFQILVSTYDSDSESWIENIQNIDIVGTTGKINFNDRGLRDPKFQFGKVVNGELPRYEE